MIHPGYIHSELDLKLLVIYITGHAAAPLTLFQIHELSLCDNGVDYFSLAQAVADLVERENLTLENDKYILTEKGKRNSEICETSLPFSVRRRCDESLKEMNRMLMREQQVQGHVEENEDGTVTTVIKFFDDKGPLIDLRVLAPNKNLANEIIAKYKTRPEATYHALMSLLQKEEL